MRRATTIGDERSPAPMAIPVSSPILRAVRRRKVLPPPQQVEGPSSSSPTSLFRHEVVDFQEIERQFGRAILLQPISLKVITWLLVSVVALSLFLLVVGQYSRKATVSGYLIPSVGTAKIFALQRGTITKVDVTEGQEVQEQQPLLTIDTTQISATGEDVNAAILRTLLGQRDELNSQIAGETQRQASERQRLTLLIQGAKDEIAQLEGKIPLQQERIKIIESLVASVAKLEAKGIVTTVEFKRRQSEALDLKQNLNSLRQQLAARQNQLTDTQYTLNQLPIVIAEKI